MVFFHLNLSLIYYYLFFVQRGVVGAAGVVGPYPRLVPAPVDKGLRRILEQGAVQIHLLKKEGKAALDKVQNIKITAVLSLSVQVCVCLIFRTTVFIC